MARYLSADWLAEAATGPPLAEPPAVVLEEVVSGAPEGTVTYRIEVGAGRARLVWPVPEGAPAADLRILTDWPTAVAVARGDLSTQRALMEGRLRVSGRPAPAGDDPYPLAGLDALPPGLRQATTFDPA